MFFRLLSTFLVFIFLVVYLHLKVPSPSYAPSPPSGPPLKAITVQAETIAPDLPSKVIIPAINLDTTVLPVSLTSDGRVEVPDNDVSWFQGGARPGNPGTAVLHGHFKNSSTKPGIFYHLSKLKLGEDIYIEDLQGQSFHYRVTDTKLVEVSQFPMDLVYGQSGESRLNLVTCAGKYDRRSQDFLKRTIVFASLVE